MVLPAILPTIHINYHQLVPNVGERESAPGIMRRYLGSYEDTPVPSRRVMVFQADECLMTKNRFRSGRQVGLDTGGTEFLPWCLMRSAEAAGILGINRVIIKCDSATGQKLQASLELIRSITGIQFEEHFE